MASPPTYPTAALIVRASKTGTFYEAKFRVPGVDGHAKQVLRRVGPAWLDRSESGAWVPRKGRVPAGHFDARKAHAAAADIVAAYVSGAEAEAKAAADKLANGPTFRTVASEYLRWLADIYGAKPATLADHWLLLAEPGAPARRGSGTLRGSIMAATGDMPAAKVTTRYIERLLAAVAA